MGPAGVKLIAKEGEGSIEQIWPSHSPVPQYNQRNRSLEANDINTGKKSNR